MRSTEAASAFAEYMATDRLETEPINSSQRPSGNLTHRLTTGIQTIIGNDTTKPPPAANISKTNTPPISLPDGRLNIGTHLPLLDGRYRYLGVLGEGASAQAVLAEDTLHKSGGLVSIKVFRRQYSYAGQRVIYLKMRLTTFITTIVVRSLNIIHITNDCRKLVL